MCLFIFSAKNASFWSRTCMWQGWALDASPLSVSRSGWIAWDRRRSTASETWLRNRSFRPCSNSKLLTGTNHLWGACTLRSRQADRLVQRKHNQLLSVCIIGIRYIALVDLLVYWNTFVAGYSTRTIIRGWPGCSEARVSAALFAIHKSFRHQLVRSGVPWSPQT